MSKIDQLLKTLQVRPSPPEALVQAYLIHIGDRSEANFRKILELKGIRKQDHASLIDLFNAHSGSPNYANLPASSPLLTPINLSAPQGTSAIAGLNVKTQTFDASTFGSALMNAAREGVDRFGSPSLGVATGGHARTASNDVASPDGSAAAVIGGAGAATAAGLNENLKNIGKFFRRDVGGRFGRSTPTTEGGR
jgi:hypothetical protein